MSGCVYLILYLPIQPAIHPNYVVAAIWRHSKNKINKRMTKKNSSSSYWSGNSKNWIAIVSMSSTQKKRREKEYFSPFAQSFLRHRALHRDWFIVLFHSPFFTHSTHFFCVCFNLDSLCCVAPWKKSSHHQFLFVIAHLTIDYYLLDHYWWWWWRRWGGKKVSLQTQYLSPISFIFQLTWILTQSHSFFLTSLITNSNILQMQFLLIKYLWIFCLISPFNGTRIGNLRFAKCFFFFVVFVAFERHIEFTEGKQAIMSHVICFFVIKILYFIKRIPYPMSATIYFWLK